MNSVFIAMSVEALKAFIYRYNESSVRLTTGLDDKGENNRLTMVFKEINSTCGCTIFILQHREHPL